MNNNEIRFELGNKAENLYFSIFDITTNRKHYPVKFRRLADHLQERALSIHASILDANALKSDLPQEKAAKLRHQTDVISSCNKLLSLIRYSLHAQLISSSTCEKWTGLVHDVKYMTLAWRKQ